MQENKSFKGLSKETMTLFILATPRQPFTPFPKDVQQLSCAMLTYGSL